MGRHFRKCATPHAQGLSSSSSLGLFHQGEGPLRVKLKRDGARSTAVAQAPDKRDRSAEAANVARLAVIDARIADIDKRLAAAIPDYAALVRPAPISVEDVQAQLRPDEALVLFLDTPE
jgi:hypothetical protein